MTFLAAIFLFLYLSFFSGRAGQPAPHPLRGSIPGSGLPEQTFGAGGPPSGRCRGADVKPTGGPACPVCAARFGPGDNVKSKIFPPGGREYRLLHISGCKYCLSGERQRLCPVCGAELSVDDYLAARIWQHPVNPEVRVRGCVHCITGATGAKHGKKVKKLR